MDMQSQQAPVERWFEAADGTRLFCRDWVLPQQRGAVQLVHGLGEHGGRYVRLAQLFNRLGWSVRVCDQRGHGHSGGRRGSLTHADDLLLDLKHSFDDFARERQCTPALFGHSMGGLVAARFATGGYSPVRALMLSSPALALDLTRWQQWLLAVSSRLAPAYSLPTALPANGISHDEAEVQAYRRDPLNHGKIAPRMLNFMLDAMHQVERDAASFTRPLLLQFAGADTLVAPRGSHSFFSQLPVTAGNTLHCYEHAFHEIFNEEPILRAQVEADLSSWLSQLPA